MSPCKPSGTGFALALTGAALLLCACVLGPSASGATYTWDGGGADNNITTAQNWVGDIVPAANSDVIWAGSVRLNVNIDVGGPGRSFTFNNTAGAFIISGAASSLSNGITNNSTNTETLNIPLTLTGAQTFNAASGNLVFGGTTLANGGFLLTIDGANNTSIANVISGSGGLTKTGAGTLTLTNTNTYTGASTISGGTVSVNRDTSLGATSGGLTINAGTLEIATTFTNTRAITLGNAASAVQVDAAQTFTVNNAITGTGALNKTGAGIMVLGGANSYTGGTNVSAGTLRISNNDKILNTTDLTVSGGTFDVQTFSETVRNVTLSSGSITGSGAGKVTASSYAVQSGTVSAILAGTGATMTKTTAGTVTLNGLNTFTGATTVSGGTLTLSSASGGALGSTTSVTVNSGGTLLVSANNQINNAATMTLAGGTFRLSGAQEGTTAATGVGALTLSSNSVIDLAGTSLLHLAASNGQTWTGTLSIYNWNGTLKTGGGAEQLLLGTTNTALTQAQLNAISFYSDSGTTFLGTGGFATVGNGEIVPVPEPATYIASIFALGVLVRHQRKRIRGFFPARSVA
jgi:fibronectin-binding autotransporter adhesin